MLHDDFVVTGLRKVYPYYFSYKTYVKKRWFGLPIVSVFVKEFQNYSEETIVCCLSYGFYMQKQLLLSAGLSHCSSVCLSIHPFVRHTGGSVKNGAS